MKVEKTAKQACRAPRALFDRSPREAPSFFSFVSLCVLVCFFALKLAYLIADVSRPRTLGVAYSVHPLLQGTIRPTYLGDAQQSPFRDDDLAADNSRSDVMI